MKATANLCAQVPVSLLAKIREEQENAGLPRGEYITQILTAYYENQNRKEEKVMESTKILALQGPTKTLAFQVPEEFFNRIKEHLERETKRTGKRLTQREFILGLIVQALGETEQKEGDHCADVG